MKITRTVRKTPKGSEVETFVLRIPKGMLQASGIDVSDNVVIIPGKGKFEVRRLK